MLQDNIAQDFFNKDYDNCSLEEQQQVNDIIHNQFT